MTSTAAPSWAGLVEDLAEQGVLSQQWRSAFLAVRREVFIPEVIWRYDMDDLVPLRRSDEPAEWLRRVHGPRYVVTQVDDGAPSGPAGRGRMVTSSASRPDIVAAMLTAGHVEPGMRALEIGTGYTAALLAHRLGAPNVTTIEIDPDLAARARAALATAGYGDVTVITGDGTQGYPDRAPFDRVLSTVAAPRVPYPWVAQTRPGGLVVTPWSSAYEPAGLLALTVNDDGTATGGLVNTTISFMPLRDQRITRAAVAEVVRDTDIPERSDTDLHACHLCNNDDAPFTIGFQVPDCHWVYEPGDDDRWCVWFLDPDTRSWARFNYQPETRRWPVHQFGPRRLFAARPGHARRWWRARGCARSRPGLDGPRRHLRHRPGSPAPTAGPGGLGTAGAAARGPPRRGGPRAGRGRARQRRRRRGRRAPCRTARGWR